MQQQPCGAFCDTASHNHALQSITSCDGQRCRTLLTEESRQWEEDNRTKSSIVEED